MKRKRMRLAELRLERGRSQTEVAERAGWLQGAVSRIEAAGDVQVSTLQRYVSALGGELVVVAVFNHGRDERQLELAPPRKPKRER